MLQRLGYEPVLAADGLEGLGLCSETAFDLILTDLQMPRMGGLEMVEELLRKPASFGGARKSFVVALTAAAMEEDRKNCLAAGMDFYLAKPVQVRELEMVIRMAWDALQNPGRRVNRV